MRKIKIGYVPIKKMPDGTLEAEIPDYAEVIGYYRANGNDFIVYFTPDTDPAIAFEM